MSRNSIGSRLWFGFAVFAALIAAAAGFVLIGASRQAAAIKELTGEVYNLQAATGHLEQDFVASELAVSSYSLSGDRNLLPVYRKARADFAAHLAEMRRLAPRNLRGYVRAQAAIGTAWFNLAGVAATLPFGTSRTKWLIRGASVVTREFIGVNAKLQRHLATDIRHLTAQSRRSFGIGLAGSAAVLGIAMVLALVASLSTLRSITRPLYRLTGTVHRLAAGDHAARADATGAAEIRNVALSVNALADESDRLRAEEDKHARLRAMARETGNRIREPLSAEDVIREACAAIEQNLKCDHVFLHLVNDGQMSGPSANENSSRTPPGFLVDLADERADWAADLLRHNASFAVQDLSGQEGEQVPSPIREQLLRLGIVSHVVTPIGFGSELIGMIAGGRTSHGRPWTAAEISAFESIAADIGRGLNHARLYEKENQLVEELQSLDRAKSDFLATVSHELRTPLTSLIGYVEMLRDQDAGPVTTAQDQMLATVDRNANRLRNLIEDVLTLSKIESGAFKSELQPTNLADLVAGAHAALQPAAAAKGLTFTSSCPDDGLVVSGDASQLDRVLINLLSNAVKFTPEGGAVQLTAAGDGDRAVVAVSDTGIGIPDLDKKALFTRFFRASNAVEGAISGTGLGLTIVQTIIVNHGGELDLQSREGEGTTVIVRIPLAVADLPTPEP